MSAKVIAGRYELIEKIGDGGMAVVYKSKDRLLNRFVAVKILKPEFTKDAKFIENFRKESHAAASLNHPNIVSVYDVGREGNINYIVMELVEGATLSDLIGSSAPFPYKKAIEIAKQIAAGLGVAHRRGIIHRDVKPHNIMMTSEGVAKITDFGIAKAITSTTIAENTSENIMGSVHYFSPEQARGGYIDEKSDIYSLGIVMYEMLTGKVPFDGENPVSVALMHINNEITPPSDIVAGIPPRLEQIVLKATSKYQTDRFASVGEMIAELDNIEFVGRIVGNSILDKEDAKGNGPEDIDDSQKDGEKKKDKKPLTKKKKIVIIVAASVAAALIILGIVGYATGFIGKKEVEIPNLKGMTYAKAEKILSKLDLEIKEGKQVFSDEYKIGEIAAQDPEGGKMIAEGSIITVGICKGSEVGSAPNVIGMTEAEARKVIEGKGYTVSVSTTKSDKAKGQVVEQNPVGGSSIKAGETMNIVISDGTGKEESPVPYLIGKDWTTAKKAITDAGFKVGTISYENSNTYAENQVMWQQYEANANMPKGTTIDVRISKGPEAKE